MDYKFDGQVYKDLESYKEALQKSDTRCNAYKEWTRDEDAELLRLARSMSIGKLADHFKRQRSAINGRLRKLRPKRVRYPGLDADSFLKAVLIGADPLTGEVLNDDSVWKHPQILKDIEEFFEDEQDADN